MDDNLSVLIKTLLQLPDPKDIKKINDEIQKNIKAIEIKIDPNILSTLNKFSSEMKNIASSVGITNDKLAKQVIIMKDENGELAKRTRTFTDNGVIETWNKISLKQKEAFENASKNINVLNQQNTITEEISKGIEQSNKAKQKSIDLTKQEIKATEDLGRITKIVTQKDDNFTPYKKDVTHRNNQGIETTVHTGEKRPTTYTEAINIEKINKELVKADLNIDKFKNKWNKKVNNLQDKYGAFINPQDLSTLNSFKTQLNSLNTDSSKKEIQDLSFALDFVISKMKEFGISQKKYTVDLAKTEVKRQTQVKKFRDDNLDKIDNTISQYSGKVSKTALVDLENLRTKIENINVADRSINANGLKEYRKEIQNTIKVVKDYAEYTKTENKRQTDVSNFKVKSTDDIDKLLNQYKLTGSKDLIKELKNVKKEIQGIDVADQEFDSKGIKEFTRRIGLLQEDLKNTKTLTKQETEQVIKLSTELAQMYRNNELVRLSVNKTGLVTATVRRADSNVEENRYYQYDRENPTKKLTSVGKDYTYINNMQKEISSFKKSAINTIDDVVLKFSKLIPQKTLTDLQKMREEISKIKITDNNINTKFLDEQSIKIKKLTSEARQLGQEQLRINKGLTFTESFKTAMERVPVWFAAMSVFYGGLRKISEGINYLIDLDNAMNQIRIVMNLNNEEAVKLGKSYNELAKSMSVTTTEIANASVEFARQGLNQEQMNNRLQNTIKYAKISGMEFKETAEIITATVNSMGISAERAVDVFSYLGRQNCPLVA